MTSGIITRTIIRLASFIFGFFHFHLMALISKQTNYCYSAASQIP
jgi:hypothetical protein